MDYEAERRRIRQDADEALAAIEKGMERAIVGCLIGTFLMGVAGGLMLARWAGAGA